MTEKQWLAANDPEPMLTFVERKTSDRKLRLFACACSRLLWDRLDHPLRQCVLAAERLADGEVSAEYAKQLLREWEDAYGSSYEGSCVLEAFEKDDEPHTGVDVAIQSSIYASHALAPSGLFSNDPEPWFRTRRAQTHIVRDIFGNPFRPITFSPEWRTDTAVALARQMYESRDFSAMPILADALQDAGCDNDDILSHCRDTKQPHVRGCWVVDLVLGKE
jgi:hypothetical protein